MCDLQNFLTWKFAHLDLLLPFSLSIYLLVFDCILLSHLFMHHSNKVVFVVIQWPQQTRVLSSLKFAPKQAFWIFVFAILVEPVCLLIQRQLLYLNRATACLFNIEMFTWYFQFLVGKDWWPMSKFPHKEICASWSPFTFQPVCLSICICFPCFSHLFMHCSNNVFVVIQWPQQT